MFSTSSNIPEREEYEKPGANFVVKDPKYFNLVRSIKNVIGK
jgi:hypothetical protein